MEAVLWMYRDRLLDLKRDGQIRDILISRRHHKPGVAGHHPYSRVTAIPIVFDETRRELREAREYYQYKRRCLYCDILRQEIAAEERIVRLTRRFAALVPYAARGPARAVDRAAPARVLLRGLAQPGVRTRPGTPAVRDSSRALGRGPSATPATSWPCTPPPTFGPESCRGTGRRSATTTTGTSRS